MNSAAFSYSPKLNIGGSLEVIGGNHWVIFDYRHSYQGSECDPEIKGDGNSYTTEFRQLDTRIGRWLSIDPKATPYESPYTSMGNSPIWMNDQLGDTTNYFSHEGKYLGTFFGDSPMKDALVDEELFMTEMNDVYGWANATENTDGTPKMYNGLNEEDFLWTDDQMEIWLNATIADIIDPDSELGMLARIGYAEFRGSNSVEQKVGMDITLNRVGSEKFPNTLKEVLEQPYQYSSLLPNDPNRQYYENPYKMAQKSTTNYNAWISTMSNAIAVYQGSSRGISQGAVLYYSPRSMLPAGSSPKWDFNKLKEIKIDGVRTSHLRLYNYK